MTGRKSKYIDYWFCSRCSGPGNAGRRIWILKKDAPDRLCPHCGSFMRGRSKTPKKIDGNIEVYQMRLRVKTDLQHNKPTKMTFQAKQRITILNLESTK